MRVELRDVIGYTHQISTVRPHLVAMWIEEFIPQMLTVNSSLGPWQITVWAQTNEEFEILKNGGQQTYVVDTIELRELLRSLSMMTDTTPTPDVLSKFKQYFDEQERKRTKWPRSN